MSFVVPDCTIVLMGATGDLTKRKLIPALYKLLADGLLQNYVFVGTGREVTTVDRIFAAAEEFVQGRNVEVWDFFKKNFRYIPVDFNVQDDYAKLKACIEQEELARGLFGNRLFFLATMPEHFSDITQALADHQIVRRNIPGEVCGDRACSWQRVIYEKPFGQNLASAQEINQKIAEVFSEQQAYRIDHYLGKELVANIGVIRFANTVFEPLWNNFYIESVQIVLKERVGVEQRGAFYDSYGALKDVVQNHMLQLLALIAMESPQRLDGECIRDAKVAVLKKASITDVLLGQYSGYQQEAHVAPDSRTETFAALKLAIDNDRWRGVPFFFKTGKSLDEKSTSIHVTFRKSPHLRSQIPGESNVLNIIIEPNDGFSLKLNGKTPGKTDQTTPVLMDFCHSCIFGPNTPEAYEVLILDALRGDQSVFVRFDEIEESWKIIDAFGAWQGPIFEYEQKSKGPAELVAWSQKHCLSWER